MTQFSTERAATIPGSKQECQQDALQRINEWLDVLEQRVLSIAQVHLLSDLKAGECEQAIDRHIALIVRLFQVRQQCAPDGRDRDRLVSLNTVLRDEGEQAGADA